MRDLEPRFVTDEGVEGSHNKRRPLIHGTDVEKVALGTIVAFGLVELGDERLALDSTHWDMAFEQLLAEPHWYASVE
jgi:hypothetical protein